MSWISTCSTRKVLARLLALFGLFTGCFIPVYYVEKLETYRSMTAFRQDESSRTAVDDYKDESFATAPEKDKKKKQPQTFPVNQWLIWEEWGKEDQRTIWEGVWATDDSPRLLGDEFCYLEQEDLEITFEKERLVGSSDPAAYFGRCHYYYPKRYPPAKGFLKDVDLYFFRGSGHYRREQCYLHCMDLLDEKEIDNQLLISATISGLTAVVEKMMDKFPHLDPLWSQPLSKGQSYNDNDAMPRRRGLNAIQEAIRGGYADIVRVLSRGNAATIIDEKGRTVADYVRMKGSPIRPIQAAYVLGVDMGMGMPSLSSVPKGRRKRRRQLDTKTSTGTTNTISDMGWSNYTSFEVDQTCDIDVIYGDISPDTFFHEYFLPGRPVIMRGQVPAAEMASFSKSRWQTTENFTLDSAFEVGPTAYPFVTGQNYCSKDMTIGEIEKATKCADMPKIPMIHALHPEQDDLNEIYSCYGGDIYDKRSSFRKIEDWFGPRHEDFTWQVFFSGDEAGATYHWHNAAFNVLYTGQKEWRIASPLFRGWTGIPARRAADRLDDSVTLKCTQQPGDMIYLPENWGHLTMNHGFAIGAAALLSSSYQKMAELPQPEESSRDESDKRRGDDGRSRADVNKKEPPFLFVHINKTGGSSLIEMLSKGCGKKYVSEHWGNGHRSFHATTISYIDHYGREAFDKAYTFAVVRHPLARQVSNFFFLASRCAEHYSDDCRTRDLPTNVNDESFTAEMKIEAFHDWLHKLYEAYPPGSPKHYLFGTRGHGNEDFDKFNATQTSWVVDSTDTIVVDRIFYLETLSDYMSELAEAIPCLKRVEMIHTNAAPSYPNYMLFAKNERSRKIIEEVYAADFKNFGYSLDE